MSAFTLRFQPIASEATIAACEERARRDGFQIAWRHARELDRSYALVERAGPSALDDLVSGTTPFTSPVIALALRPNLREALPALAAALGGRGRPAGVRGCEIVGEDTLVVEWDLDVSSATLVLGVIRVELSRIQASCVNELLAPLPLSWWTRLAAEGLSAPEIAPDRVLEALLEEHDVAP